MYLNTSMVNFGILKKKPILALTILLISGVLCLALANKYFYTDTHRLENKKENLPEATENRSRITTPYLLDNRILEDMHCESESTDDDLGKADMDDNNINILDTGYSHPKKILNAPGNSKKNTQLRPANEKSKESLLIPTIDPFPTEAASKENTISRPCENLKSQHHKNHNRGVKEDEHYNNDVELISDGNKWVNGK